jgi:hypothetical protein
MNANQEWIKASKKWIKNAKLSIESNLLERDLLKKQNAINIAKDNSFRSAIRSHEKCY